MFILSLSLFLFLNSYEDLLCARTHGDAYKYVQHPY